VPMACMCDMTADVIIQGVVRMGLPYLI